MSFPRPILKHSSSTPVHRNAVHFPPSPSLLTRTFSAHSSTSYDRSPIVVAPNSCAIPPRGCPGRTYSIDDPAPRTGRVLHPRALIDIQRPPTPPLIPDLSSESDESDSSFHPPPDHTHMHTHTHTHTHMLIPPAYPIYPLVGPTDVQLQMQNLAFLPHAPCAAYESDDAQPKTRRRPQRRRERSRDRSRIRVAPDGGERDDEGEVEAPVLSVYAGPAKRGAGRIRVAESFGFGDADAGLGCLGGF